MFMDNVISGSLITAYNLIILKYLQLSSEKLQLNEASLRSFVNLFVKY